MVSSAKLAQLREIITENLRVQRDGERTYRLHKYWGGTSRRVLEAEPRNLCSARMRKNLTSASFLTCPAQRCEIHLLNCEDFKRHSFPNVLIQILSTLFRELDRHRRGWFGKKKRSKEIIRSIIARLDRLQQTADVHDEDVKHKNAAQIETGVDGSATADIDHLKISLGAKDNTRESQEIERSFKVHREKLQELDRWLPELKESIREFFQLSNNTSAIVLQIDDLYHLRRTDQAFVVDYIHRLCKDIPLYFKIATLRHASTLYADRDGQPIWRSGAA